jgi:hypothetical protein
MAEEIIANFRLEPQQSTTATFTMQEHNINANFSMQRATEDKHFVFEQAISSDTWVIVHNMKKKPSITIVDEYDRRIVGFAAKYIDNNSLEVYFKCAFKGRAYLN